MPEAPPTVRPGREASRQRRSRLFRFGAVALAVLLVGGAAMWFFVLRDDDGSGSSAAPEEEAPPRTESLELQLADVRNENGGPPAQLSREQQQQIMDLVSRYVDEGLIAPVLTGEAPGEETISLFELSPAVQLEAGDAAIVFEEGVPPLDGRFRAQANPVPLTALSDQLGFVVLVTAQLAYHGRAETEQGIVTIDRFVELTFVPFESEWKITGYDVSLDRKERAPTGTTTTTAEASSS